MFYRLTLTLLLLVAPLSAALEQGVALRLEVAGKHDGRRDRLVALHVPAGQPASPFLPAGAFTARWEGALVSEVRQEVRFRVFMTGKATLQINGKALNDLAEGTDVVLNKGENNFVLTFTSPPSGDATLRLEWAGRGFPWEPFPPEALRHDPALVAAGETLRHGRTLVAQMACLRCHQPATPLAAGAAMPELTALAPLLINVGERHRADFLAHWIQNPHAHRPGTAMPKVFPPAKDGTVDPRAADLAAFLTSQGKPAETAAPNPKLAAEGGVIFANQGCIACHTQPKVPASEAKDRVPLAHVAAKWHGPALVAYLRDPAQHHPSTRMPNYALSVEEAERLAAYLLAEASWRAPATPPGDAARGATLLVSEGCINCHAGAPVGNQPSLAATIAKGWMHGCVADDAAGRGKAPNFEFTSDQLKALRAFAQTDLSSLRRDVPAERARRAVAELNCVACHAADGSSSKWTGLKSEVSALRAAAPPRPPLPGEPSVDGPVPALTWLGEKLKVDWSTAFIAGVPQPKPRYWLAARMPAFAHHASDLALGLSHQHGFPATEPVEPAPNSERLVIGKQLLESAGGFNCVQCHPVGGRSATAPFEAPSTNLATATARLRRLYYDRWMLAPTRIDGASKMPIYADEDGLTQLTEIEDGDAASQFGAIWDYLRTQQGPGGNPAR